MPPRTNGIREVVGEVLTPDFALRFAHAVSKVVVPDRPIAISRDARTSSPALAGILGSTWLLEGRDVVDLGLLPTPAFQYAMPRTTAAFGVVVTASHNPAEYNGFKCVDERGRSISREIEEAIERGMQTPPDAAARYDRVGSEIPGPPAASQYVDGVVGGVDRERISRRRFTVVLDCGNGVTAVTSPTILRRLGCRVISLNAHLDGRFPGRPSEPNEATLAPLAEVVRATGADLGIAHDGDGDRTLFIDGTGRFVTGDRSLALLARESVRVAKGGTVVTPVSTSQVVEEVLEPLGGSVVYTPVGSRSLSAEVERTGAVLGGEENGGVIFPRWQLARDGAMTAAAFLDLLSAAQEPLTELVRKLPAYASVKSRVKCPSIQVEPVLSSVAQDLSQGASRVVTLDGWKFYTETGWVLLRASGTEPIIRVFAESRSVSHAQRLADDAVARLQDRIGEARA